LKRTGGFGVVLAALLAVTVQAGGERVLLLPIEGAIGPATSDLVARTLRRAEDNQAGLLILQLDTPGGLDSSMREIIKRINTSSVPVVAYVAPSGARAASAGTYILYASHIAAMAQGTNLGAATPVPIGGGFPKLPTGGAGKGGKGPSGKGAPEQEAPGTGGDAMHQKIVNDAVAYIRGLAELRGRNADWAEQAVRKAASLPAREALALKVIDLVAVDIDDLLEQIDGRVVMVDNRPLTLHTRGLRVERVEPDWRSRLLAVITNPNVAYFLMIIGLYGLIFEFPSPGAVLPGVIGGICLLLALFAFQVLPVNYAGLGLLLLGVALMVAEAFVPSFGVLGIGGLVSFVIGSVLLIDVDQLGYGIDPLLIGSVALVSGLFFVFVIGLAVKAQKNPVVSGMEEMCGATGVALEAFVRQGRVRVHGEAWNAVAARPIHKGEAVRVTHLDGLTLTVEPVTRSAMEESS